MCKKLLVTGGAGFIGSQFVRDFKNEYAITVYDKLSYAGDLKRIENTEVIYRPVDIVEKEELDRAIYCDEPDVIVHFAAETHVDRSIKDSRVFLDTNIIGTHNLLECCRGRNIKFIYISTDEVYGEIKEGKFTEESPLKPNNPYSVSKASADMLVQSFIRTYNIRANIIRPCNNYGIWQYPEKLIPVVVYKALTGQKIPVYGQGLQIREWLNIKDTVKAIKLIIEKAPNGEIYNVGSGEEEKNIVVVRSILNILGKDESLIEFVKDRPGHDVRYCLDTTKINNLGWKPEVKFYSGFLSSLKGGLEETVKWNEEHIDWLKSKLC